MRLAFVDHHLANFHADTFHRLITTTFADRGIEVIAWESDPTGSAATPDPDWCAARGVVRAESLAEAVQAADAVLVLAPDNLDTHLGFAEEIVPARKPVVFDKLLALDPAEADQIVRLAEEVQTPIFSGSALRYAVEVEEMLAGVEADTIEDAFARGYGAWDHYGIHTLSLGVRLGGFAINRVRESGTADSRQFTLDHGDRRTTIDCRTGANADSALGWTCGVQVAGQWRTATIGDFNGFYTNLVGHYLDFLTGGEPESSPRDLARLVRVLAGSQASLAAGGDWIEV